MNDNNTPLIGRIHSLGDRFGTVDGPGIRFLAFMQGCPMRCLFCHNPDTWDLKAEVKYEWTPEQLLEETLRYRTYIKSGGVTCTGGEPLMQAPFVEAYFRLCHSEGIHTALDTSGVIFNDAVRSLLEVTDLVLLDIKTVDDELHRRLTAHPRTHNHRDAGIPAGDRQARVDPPCRHPGHQRRRRAPAGHGPLCGPLQRGGARGHPAIPRPGCLQVREHGPAIPSRRHTGPLRGEKEPCSGTLQKRIVMQSSVNDDLYRRCGRSGVLLPRISLGLWHNFGECDDPDKARRTILTAYEQGVVHADLANNYGPPPGAAERTLGRILRTDLASHRDELFISTKAGYEMWPGPYGNWGSRKSLMASIDQSTARLGLPYVDLFYIHRYDPLTPLEETLRALVDIVRSGRALYIGISRWPLEALRRAVEWLGQRDCPPLIYQGRLNLLDRAPMEDGILDFVPRQVWVSLRFSPLAQGASHRQIPLGHGSRGKPHAQGAFPQKQHADPGTAIATAPMERHRPGFAHHPGTRRPEVGGHTPRRHLHTGRGQFPGATAGFAACTDGTAAGPMIPVPMV